ncbi:hypothetical protein ACN20G_10250 [Streptomyces sp. BI20]|uniref:hypothetical protein n=1 Tax=Streptomyces sp. BI20 TaxID=3403460 RepID=UPI003C788521
MSAVEPPVPFASSSLPRAYRMGPAQRRGMYVAAGLGTPVCMFPLITLQDASAGLKLGLAALILLLFGWLLWRAPRCATHADLKGVRVTRFLSTRRLDWSGIQGFAAAPNPSAGAHRNQPRVLGHVHDARGRRVQLMYLDDNHVDVERELALLTEAWEELRGPDWRADEQARARIERTAARERGLLAAMGVGCATGLVLIVIVVAVVLLSGD